MLKCMKRAFFAYFIVFLFFLFSTGFSVMAVTGLGTSITGGSSGYCQQIVPCGPGTSKTNCTLCDLFTLVKNILDCVLFRIVPVVAVLLIAYGGLLMIIAYAEGSGEEKLGKAKKTISAVIIGLLIIYGSWLIVDTFLKTIGYINSGSWNTITCS